jgi:hypothetical protein
VSDQKIYKEGLSWANFKAHVGYESMSDDVKFSKRLLIAWRELIVKTKLNSEGSFKKI